MGDETWSLYPPRALSLAFLSLLALVKPEAYAEESSPYQTSKVGLGAYAQMTFYKSQQEKMHYDQDRALGNCEITPGKFNAGSVVLPS